MMLNNYDMNLDVRKARTEKSAASSKILHCESDKQKDLHANSRPYEYKDTIITTNKQRNLTHKSSNFGGCGCSRSRMGLNDWLLKIQRASLAPAPK
jgi:hypothetical protein